MTTTTNDLLTWVQDRVEAAKALDDQVGLLVLAALEGDPQLNDYLDAGATAGREADGADDDSADRATGDLLRSLQVAGFRGIGAQTTLDPAPGLTVVAGRNGSGKSSLAEGLEVLLTGGTYLWKNKRSTQWAEL